MTKEQLLVPRWKVIADFPGNTFYIGEIFDLPSEFTHQQIIIKGNNEEIDLDVDLHKYPLIFRKLEWWEDRKLEDMPKYIKFRNSNILFETDTYTGHGEAIMNKTNVHHNLYYYLPATEEEYLKQNNG